MACVRAEQLTAAQHSATREQHWGMQRADRGGSILIPPAAMAWKTLNESCFNAR
jgi:hypothetical protein